MPTQLRTVYLKHNTALEVDKQEVTAINLYEQSLIQQILLTTKICCHTYFMLAIKLAGYMGGGK